MKRLIIFTIIVLSTVFGTFADTISDGWWAQTASTAGEGENVAMEVKSVTPHIITLDSNNGWVGYAWYDAEKDLYTGFFELTMQETDNATQSWVGEVFHFTLCYDGLTLTMKAKSSVEDFNATFWVNEDYNTDQIDQ